METAETLAWVTGLGCTQAQGNLFAKAMPAQDIPAYLAAEFIAASEGAQDAASELIAASSPSTRRISISS